MIAATIYNKQAQAKLLTIYDDTNNSYHGRGRWIVTDHKARVKYIVYRESNGTLICPCGRKGDCEHRKAIREYLNNGGGNGSKITNECGSEHAKALQDKMNGQLNSQNDNGNGAKQAPSLNIDPSAKPFMESDELDAKQIETGEGDKVHHLSNGRYVISYLGIQHLANKHGIMTETWKDTPSEGYITVKAMRPDTKNVRKSCQPVNGSFEVAEGKAKRNAVRMLLPLVDIKAIEHKAKVESEFSWEAAKAACLRHVNDANLSIITEYLQRDGTIERNNPSHLSRRDWRVVYEACKQDAEIERDPKSLNRWSYNSAEFLEKCREAIQQVRDAKSVEANEQSLEGDNGKRKLQMDSKLRTWLIESDGTKNSISCREICLEYDPKIVSRLRTGIDSGADISTVELDD